MFFIVAALAAAVTMSQVKVDGQKVFTPCDANTECQHPAFK